MPLITKKEAKDTQIRVRINEDVLAEINEYIEWAGLNNVSSFLEEATIYVLRKDKEWKQAKVKKDKE